MTRSAVLERFFQRVRLLGNERQKQTSSIYSVHKDLPVSEKLVTTVAKCRFPNENERSKQNSHGVRVRILGHACRKTQVSKPTDSRPDAPQESAMPRDTAARNPVSDDMSPRPAGERRNPLTCK